MRGHGLAFILPRFKKTSPNERRAKRVRDGLKHIVLAVWADEPPEQERVPLLEAKDKHCRWPYGEGMDLLFCGQDAVIGTSWCPYHLRRAMPPRLAEELMQRKLAAKSGLED